MNDGKPRVPRDPPAAPSPSPPEPARAPLAHLAACATPPLGLHDDAAAPAPATPAASCADWHKPGCVSAPFCACATEEIARLRQQKDGAYRERDQVVALAARMATVLRWPTWLGHHEDKPGDPPWDEDWRNIVFIDLPSGQVSWHIHDSELPLMRLLPSAFSSIASPWDGHDMAEKYRRCDAPWPVDDDGPVYRGDTNWKPHGGAAATKEGSDHE